MQETVIARWESRGGASYVILCRDASGYSYKAKNAAGCLGMLASDDAAIRSMERRINDFQPDRNASGMRRVVPVQCSICRDWHGKEVQHTCE